VGARTPARTGCIRFHNHAGGLNNAYVKIVKRSEMASFEPSESLRAIRDAGFLSGGGQLGDLIRAKDWGPTPLGPIDRWPQALRTAVRIMLTSRQPMFVWWGRDLTNLYNDAYCSILGGKHPRALGQPARVVWREIWDQVGPRAQSALLGNSGTYDESLLLIMERHAYPEETYYTFSYSPVPDDDGGIGGIFCANTEDTQRIVGERQLKLLRELAAETAEARSIEDACTRGARCLESDNRDLPFALIYLYSQDHHRITLAGSSGIAGGHPMAPLETATRDASIWPFHEVTRTNAPVLVKRLQAGGAELPAGAWDRPPDQAVAVPIAASGKTGRPGFLIAGLSPYRVYDDRYEGFLKLIAGQIAAAIANAQVYEEERKRAEALAELDRAKTAFFSNVSHEFRTPLTLLLGTLEEMLGTDHAPAGPEEQSRLLAEVAHRNGLRLLKLVNSLLEFSRIEAGRVQAAYQATDLCALTEDLASSFRSAMEKAGLEFGVHCEPLPEPVYVDHDMWEKVVLNLLSNAFKFTFEGEVEVILQASGDGRAAEFAVRDTGTGIPQEELPRLFERFHRVEGARGRTHEGTGIGLALVQELVKLHGGSIQVESEAGKGSTFRVQIPFGTAHLAPERVSVVSAPSSTAVKADAYVEEALRWLPDDGGSDGSVLALPPQRDGRQQEDGGRPTVLLADDNADMREYLKRLLAPRYQVHAVNNGASALEWAREYPPDVVLTDIMMPELDGYGLLQGLRAQPQTSAVPVILVSARAGEEAKIEGLGAGADDYLIKPFGARELLARVDTHVKLAEVRRKAAAEVRASDLRFRRLFEANIFAVALGDFSGRILDANDAFLKLVGYSRDDLKAGLVSWERTPSEYRELDLRATKELRERGTSTPYEKEFVRKDESRVPMLIGGAVLQDPGEAQDTWFAFCLDLTERRKIEAQLGHTQKLESLGVLAGGVAHDFNNLLVGIMGNASLALESTSSSSPNRLLLEDVVTASERAADLTRQLLAYAGKGRFIVQPVDISTLIREIANLIQASIPKQAQLRLELEDGLPCIEADATQIQQLVMNLIINGAEAIGDHVGTVMVTSGVQQVDEYYMKSVPSGYGLSPGRFVFLEVQDTGCGMDQETVARIFDPFFTTKLMGRGLGLAAALGIVRGHHGAIKVYSQPGRGSTFKVLFPAQEQTAQTGSHAAPYRDLTGTGVVLVVDDEDVVRRTVKTALQRYGYAVLTAANGQDGVDLYRELHDRLTAVVLDMTMPVMGGEEALGHMQSINPNVPVILSSGFNEVEAVQRFAGKGLAAKLKQARERPEAI
jgi:PAS domain S-box-containing protein